MLHFTSHQYRGCNVETAAADGYINRKWQGYYRVSRVGQGSFGAALDVLHDTREAAEAAALMAGKKAADNAG